MSLSAGMRLGPYEILSPLGAGGMGEVYRARDPRLRREVAIKVLPASFSQEPDRLRRFKQEAEAASALNHPNIVTIHDIGTQDRSPYVVSELLEGETLRTRLAGGAFPPRKALGHVLQIAHGLAAAALSDTSVPAPSTAARPRARTLKLAASLIVALVVLAAAVFLLRPRGRAIDSLAVLPFANANGDAGSDYLSDGVTESLTNSLSQLPNLHVTARTIARRYKGKDSDPQKAGRELGVRAVVSGKVLQRGDTLTIQADLVDVGSGTQLWGDHYNKKMTDILAVQEEIATEISEKLRIRLTGEQRKRFTKRATENTEAYEAYLKGRYYFEHRNEKVLDTAIEYFNKATEKDPGHALAYSGLADSYVVMPSYSVQAPKEAYPRARPATAAPLCVVGAGEGETLMPARLNITMDEPSTGY